LYREQAGLWLAWFKLADLGIRGTSHVMMLEKNSKQIAVVINAGRIKHSRRRKMASG
jgi:hypothetical protein